MDYSLNLDTTKTFNKKSLVRKKPSYVSLSNTYASLLDFAVDPPDCNVLPSTPTASTSAAQL